MFSLANRPLKQSAVQILRDKVDDVLLVRRARDGVDDEYYLGLFLRISRCKGINKLRVMSQELRKIHNKGKNNE